MTEPVDDPQREELIAFLDGELDESATQQMEERLAADPRLRREVEQMKRTWELLDFLPQPEPSPGFASKTLEQLSLVVPSAPPATTKATLPTTTVAIPLRNPWPKRVAIAAAAAAVLAIGYFLPGPFLKKPPPPLSDNEREQLMARDLRVVEQLPLYQLGDDMTFVTGLDQPDLFGEP